MSQAVVGECHQSEISFIPRKVLKTSSIKSYMCAFVVSSMASNEGCDCTVLYLTFQPAYWCFAPVFFNHDPLHVLC